MADRRGLLDLEDDLMFKETLLESLDLEADDYATQKAQLDAEIQELNSKIEALQSGGSSENVTNGGASGGSTLKRAYDHLEPDRAAEGKRSRKHSPEITPGPSSYPQTYLNRRQSALERQQQAEQAYLQTIRDQQLARSYSQSPSAFNNRFSGPSSQAVLKKDLSFRKPKISAEKPSVLYPAPYATQSPYQGSSNHASRYSSNQASVSTPMPYRPGTNSVPIIDLAGDDDNTVKAERYPPIKPEVKSENRNLELWNPRNQQSRRSSSGDSDLVEITAQDFSPAASRSGLPHMQGPSQGHVQPVQPTWRQRVEEARAAAVASVSGYGRSIYNAIKPEIQPPPYGIPQNINTMPGAWPKNYGQPIAPRYHLHGQGSSQNPFEIEVPEVLEDDMYNRAFGVADNVDYDRFNYLYADSTKTAEELNKLLANISPDDDVPPELREGTPEAMAVTLLEHQKIGLKWLKDQESGQNKGGILADDMGLGKTIQAIALIVSRRSEDPACKTTLILAPVALMNQWEQEIKEKVKGGRHALSVCKYHGASKKPWDKLKTYDVVLTTYGSLAQEFKKREHWDKVLHQNPTAMPSKKEQLNIIGHQCKWYRVIADEAQCIKNRNTATAKGAAYLRAKYRLCMTGTPMMNNVIELYSLISFCRIRPYNHWESFRKDISNPLAGRAHQHQVDQAMKRLQALIKAIMLRRTKKSKLDGKPLISLPDRETQRAECQFTEDEQTFYSDLEKRNQMQFNKYYKEGTVLKNYAHVLTLLLRLRQACCHPHLAVEYASQTELDTETMIDFAKQLEPQVIDRLKENEGNFECPLCMDAHDNPMIFFPCGHYACAECLARMTDPTAVQTSGDGSNALAKCHLCRSPVDPKKVLDFSTFKKVHQQDLLTEEERAALENADDGNGNDDDSDSDSDDSEDDSDSESETNSLNGFIVDDDEDEDNKRKTRSKNKTSNKGKGKARARQDETDDEEDEVLKNEKDEFDEDDEAKVKTDEAKDEETEDEDDSGKPAVKEDIPEGNASEETSKSRTRKKPSFMRPGKEQGNGKGKKKKQKKKMTLAQLKAEAMRNKKAKARYLKRLRKFYEPSSKIERMIALIDEIQKKSPGEKVLVFSQFTSLLDLCEIPMRESGFNYTRYDGSMNPKARTEAIQYFKNKKDCVAIFISLKAGNAGLNLNFANHVIIMDPFWNPYVEEQAIDRAHRIGQTRDVHIYRVIVPGTVEDRIIALQEKKRDLIEQALDENAGRTLSRLGVRELAYLFGMGGSA